MKIVLLTLLMILGCYAHASLAVFSHFGARQGLTDDNIRSIVEDRSGYIWVGTSSGLYKFDGLVFEKIDTSAIAVSIRVQSLYVDEDNSLLIGSLYHGLLRYDHMGLRKIAIVDDSQVSVNAIIKDHEDQLWLATSLGLFQQHTNDSFAKTEILPLSFLQSDSINTIEKLNGKAMAIALKGQIYIYNQQSQQVKTITLDEGDSVHDLHEDELGSLWVATSKSLFRYDWKNQESLPVPHLTQASRILSIDEYNDHMWIATIEGGLFKIDKKTLDVKQFLTQRNMPFSLSENNLMTVYITSSGMLWAGGFSSGLNGLDLNLNHFNYYSVADENLSCISDPHIYSIQKDKINRLWLGNSIGLVKWQQTIEKCQFIDQIANSDIVGFSVLDIQVDDMGLWVASSVGLLRYDYQSESLTMVNKDMKGVVVFFIHKVNKQQLLLGTSVGILTYNITEKTIKTLALPDEKFNAISFKNYVKNSDGEFFFSTSKGLLYLGKDKQLREFEGLDKVFVGKNILSIATDQRGHLYISVENFGLFHLDANHQLVQHYYQNHKDIIISEIIPDEIITQLWLSTNKGIASLNLTNHESTLYTSETLINHWELDQTSYRDNNGNFYFGGKGGFVEFEPENIETTPRVFSLVFNKLLLKNTAVTQGIETDSGFVLDTPIEQVENLTFSHRDTIIGFEFIQLNYNNPKEVDYYYRLKPLSSEWVSLPNNERHLTFNNLKSGTYQLDIKSRYFTDESFQTLSFTIKAPPWLSWWAFVCYAIVAIVMVFIYIKRKIAAEKKINAYLNQQVKQQTKHIAEQKKTVEQQKQTVEELMVRKNEIFSNVSHEFRTPITLILGPIEELQRVEKEAAKKDNFDMIARNARRLLNLVNQMLKLAQINETDKTQKYVIDLSSRLNMIIEPFVYLSTKKDINLKVHPLDEAKLSLTEDALETIVSNFLSNAIKYTPKGGTVSIGTRCLEEQVSIFVKDSGHGISQEDQKSVFKRFNRLNQEGSSPGTGIGLALVKELADVNDAQLHLESIPGQGSEFSITFTIDPALQNHSDTIATLDLANETHLEENIISDKQTVLIIDDNDDMRQYIKQVLSKHFTCLLAVDGLDGIAKALKYVPDIIVCDVMMPKVDGFQVCRQLRHEIITSHIPLVLLTAVNEKSSRIKGWRENIDRYLNKPFDARELVIQLKNILNTRQLLIKNTGESNAPLNSYFSETDQQFIDKLKKIIEEGYYDPLFNVQKMASLMFVSDRQLQRKTKALINDSPMDMLRQVRLVKSTELLMTGKQISYVSDVCGFSSMSYFSRSFKKNYGMSPRAYQQLKKNQR